MSNVYPLLEDLNVDQYVKTQIAAEITSAAAAGGEAGALVALSGSSLYSGLGLEELMQYAGLDVSQTALVAHMPHEVLSQMKPIACITSPKDAGMAAAAIKQGIRELVLAKDAAGKLGVVMRAHDKGVFVAFVWRDSPAAHAGLRFGDQVLQVNGQSVAGWSSDKVMDFLKKAEPRRISIVVRDRPYERTVTVVKDSMNHIGFIFKDGEITALVKDSSAARNGMLINHQLVEVNGQNVVGLKDADVVKIIADAPVSVTLTIMPTFIFKHLIKSIGSGLKKHMDRSMPEY